MSDIDSRLVEECLSGNNGAFELIVNRYLKSIYNFAFRFCNSADEANDLTQEVFLKVWKNLKRFNPNQGFKTWLFAIARNTIIDWLRKNKSVAFSSLDTEEERFEDSLVDIDPLPDEVLSRKEIAHELEKALIKIPPHYKTIILLHDIEDLSFEEIAKIVGRPMNTVKSQYRRSLLMLRKYLS